MDSYLNSRSGPGCETKLRRLSQDGNILGLGPAACCGKCGCPPFRSSPKYKKRTVARMMFLAMNKHRTISTPRHRQRTQQREIMSAGSWPSPEHVKRPCPATCRPSICAQPARQRLGLASWSCKATQVASGIGAPGPWVSHLTWSSAPPQ